MENSRWPLPFAAPEEVGFSSERLARIRPAMQRFIDQKKAPNIVTLVARDGRIAHFEAQGYLDLDDRQPVTRDAIFRLFSNSKPVAGAATMMLYEEGKLNLDDPVSRYISAFKNPKVIASPKTGGGRPAAPWEVPTVPAGREITIRDCLRNTTGLATPQRAPASFMRQYRDIIPDSGWDLTENLNIPPRDGYRKRVEAHAKLPLTFEPGTGFEYHVGYPVIGVIIEQITGQTLEEFYRERIFGPLGMKDTSFYLADENLGRFTACYQPVFKSEAWGITVFDKAATSEKRKGPKVCFAAGGDMGGLLSTAADYARFGQMLLNKGELDGVRLLGRKSVDLMTASHTGSLIIPMLGPGFGFGMGVGVHTGGGPNPILRSVGTYGWGGAAGTTFFADPKERILAICFTQVLNDMIMPENNYRDEFERLVYQALL